jgi:hypothetical protein
VLSLALSALAGWFGVRVSPFAFAGSVRGALLAYGALVGAAGWTLARLDLRRHFLDAYLHVAANAVLGALASGAVANDHALWLVALLVAAGASVERGIAFKRFAFVAYGVGYAYVGVSAQAMRMFRGALLIESYFLASAAAAAAALILVARRFGQDA